MTIHGAAPPLDPRLWKAAALDHSISTTALGSLFDPWGNHPVGKVHEKIADIYGVAKSLISTNGTTALNKLALFALLQPGDVVLVERDCHVSVVQALNEIGATPVWLLPPFDKELGINLASTPEAIAAELDRHHDVRAVVLTSPKYFGVVGDIAACVKTCHDHGAMVLVDEAHGACLRFHPDLPVSATAVGADVVTQSTHKVTEAWSQGSLMLINNADLCPRLLHALHGTAALSTSFHFGILASVEVAVTNLERSGRVRLDAALRLAHVLREGVRRIDGLAAWGPEQAGKPGFRQLDSLRVTVGVTKLGIPGLEVDALLQAKDQEHAIIAELGTLRHVLFILTYGHQMADVTRLLDRLRAIAASAPRSRRTLAPVNIPSALPEQALSPRTAFWEIARGAVQRVPVNESIGRVSAECIAVYPPGNAMIVHGERITEEVVAYLEQAAGAGAFLKGATDPEFATVGILPDDQRVRRLLSEAAGPRGAWRNHGLKASLRGCPVTVDFGRRRSGSGNACEDGQRASSRRG